MSPLDHLESTVADAYRKELDQEDNVWRTLPFFAATLAVESGGLTQLREPVLAVTGAASWIVGGLGVVIAAATLLAIVFLVRSIAPADFIYIASEPRLLDYVIELERAEADGELTRDEALETFKRFMVGQYAATTDNNRAINKHRARMRTIAGIATLASVLVTFTLGGVIIVHQIYDRGQPGRPHVARPAEARAKEVAQAAGATPIAGGAEGLVFRQGVDRDRGRGGAGER